MLKRANLPSVVTKSEKQYKAELIKYRDELFIDIITGAKPLSKFDEFVTYWNNNGGKLMEEEVNKWSKEFWGK